MLLTEGLQTLGKSSDFLALGVAHEEPSFRSVREADSGRDVDRVAT